MEFKQNDVEEKLMDHENKSNYRIDVWEDVMERISSLPPKKAKSNVMRKPLVTAASLLLLTSLSITVYAATELIQIRSKEGKVILETTPKPEESKDKAEKIEQLYSLNVASRSLAWRSALPGQSIAYYIHDQEINDLKKEIYGRDQLLDFDTGEIHLGALNVLKEEAKKSGLSYTEYPSRLLDDYSFSEGMISFEQNLSKYFDEGGPTEAYYDIQNELIRQAEASKNNKKVFVKVLDQPKVGTVSLSYTKDREPEPSFTVYATKRSGLAAAQGVQYTNEDHVEKVIVLDQEMIYIKYADAHFNQALTWVDEQNDLHYHISVNHIAHMTKEAILKVAESFIP